MTSENKNTPLKIAVAALAVILIALAVYTVNLYNTNKETVAGLELQKENIETELEELIVNYDRVIKDNELKDSTLIAARTRIETLLDSVKDAKANVALIKRYRAELSRLKEERVVLFRKADSLIAVNQALAFERDSTQMVLGQTQVQVKNISEENQRLSETVKQGSVVKAIDLRGEGVIIRKSGKIIDTKRAKRAQKIRACFTLTPNAIAAKGDRVLYIQVINPNNKLIGDRESYQHQGGILNYSAATTVYYEKDELDVCIMVNATEADLMEGKYTLNLYDGATQVATTMMLLK